MDAETISTLRTVCTAGRARSGFNEESNARLEQLAEDGFLVAVNVPKAKGPRRSYKPTEKARELLYQLSHQGVA